MSRLSSTRGIVLIASLAVVPFVATAAPTEAPSPPANAEADSFSLSRARSITVLPGDDWNALCLRRAVHRFWVGDPSGAVDVLRMRDADGSGSERADFLLAYGLHLLGDRPGFLEEAMRWRVATDDSDYRRWLTTLELLERATGTDSSDDFPELTTAEPVATLIAAELLLRRGEPAEARRTLESGAASGAPAVLRDALMVRALDATGEDATVPLAALAKRSPVLDLEFDLVTAARIRMGAAGLASGHDFRSWLDGNPPGTSNASRADHILGKAELEAGDVVDGTARLEALLQRDPSYANRRDVHRALGFLALEGQDWDEAYARLSAVESDWRDEDAQLVALASDTTGAAVDRVWRSWQTSPRSGTLGLDTAPTDRSLEQIVRDVLSLHAEPPHASLEPAAFFVARPDPSLPPSVTGPDSARWAMAEEMRLALEEAKLDAARSQSDLDRVTADLALRAEYYALGSRKATEERGSIDDTIARIDALLARSNEIVADLDRVRNEEIRRIAVRTAGFLQTSRENLVIARSMQHFYIEGPMRTRPEALPPGIPTPAEILAAEQDLVGVLEQWFMTFAELSPALIDRSHDEIWKPRATEGVQALARAAQDQWNRATDLLAAIDESREGVTGEAQLASWREAADRDAEKAATLEVLAGDLKRNLVRDAIRDARARIAAEQEGIAYALAAATHERSVALGRDRTDPIVRDLAAALTSEAADRYAAFLRNYPNSPARSEVRFRRGDVLMLAARDDFHDKMTRFLGETPQDEQPLDRTALAPFVDYGPALAEYRTLLDEDPAYAHTDAVLYHVGMILSDDGDPAATEHLTRLVEEFPDSRYQQEAHLRLGDDLFLRKDYAACIPHYERAADGSDPEHAAIALYKAGWAHYNTDEFEQGAVSFRRLLDLYAARDDAKGSTDLEREAEEYLVHCLARAGGASAFAKLFDGSQNHDYESRLLASLGHLLRRFSLFEEAAATDSLWIERYPTAPGALEAAERLVNTFARADLDASARAARLQYAPLFLEGSAWFETNDSDSLRAAGEEFARTSYKTVALYHHHEARDHGDAADWKAALELYESLSTRWPEHGETPTLHYYSGEAAAALKDYARAIEHFDTAASSDTASFRVDAAWHAIAVRDAWYESVPAHPDSLARPLITAIDGFAAAHGDDERCADLVWRKANLAYDHGWLPDALAGFAQFAQAYPTDERALPAARLRAQVLYETEDFDAAGDAYGIALELAVAAGDSSAAELRPLVPHCAFKHAEQVASHENAASTGESALLFEQLALRWPSFEHADQALYRAGLNFDASSKPADAVRSWSTLVTQYPESEYVRDAHLKIAHTWEAAERPEAASRAFARFADAFPEDEDAAPSLLRAIDLADLSGDAVGAESMRDEYLKRYPGDVDTAFDILGKRASRELASVGPDRSISSLLTITNAAEGASLRKYLELAQAQPDKASRALLAEVRFQQGEEAMRTYSSRRITLPLAPSITEKKSLLENVLQEYRECAAFAVAPWNRAAAYRIGECLVAFGDALNASERPADLSGDDLLAYDEVLEEQSWEFFDKGEQTWGEMLRQVGEDEAGGEWVVKARKSLWPRVAVRFVHRPEVEYPLVAAREPEGS